MLDWIDVSFCGDPWGEAVALAHGEVSQGGTLKFEGVRSVGRPMFL